MNTKFTVEDKETERDGRDAKAFLSVIALIMTDEFLSLSGDNRKRS